MSTNALVPFTFNSIKLFTVTINGKQWSRAKEICQSLNYTKKTPDVIVDHVSLENRAYKYQLTEFPETGKLVKWPTDSRKDEYYINEEGMYELAFTSQQKEAKEFRKYCFNTLFPQIRDHFEQLAINVKDREHQLAIEDMGREHQLAIEDVGREHQLAIEDMGREHQQVIEEKDDEIHNLVRNRHVPHSGNIDNILCVVAKNNPDETKPGRHPYYMIRSQKKALPKHLNILRDKYPNMIVKEPECDDPNAVHCWNRFKTDILTKHNYYRNHFSLPEEVRELFEGMFNIDM